MTTASKERPIARELPRVLGEYDSGTPGPTLLVCAGMHGNEPAGVEAVRRVLAQLTEREPALRGRLVCLAGNLHALRDGKRYQQRDLNRSWTAAEVAGLLAREANTLRSEDREQRELLAEFERVLATATGPVVFLDLHTSSAAGSPFLCLADTIDNRRLGLATTVPIILGIEETLHGTALEWFASRGICGMALEGGQHQSEHAPSNHAAAVWLLLERLRMLDVSPSDLAPHRAQLQQATAGLPRIVEIIHRHSITAADQFTMQPGFRNFDAVAAGQVLAADVRGELRAPTACRVLLPLYQSQGDDGFFLARDVQPFWLAVARWLRALQFDRLVRFLPGVRTAPEDRDTLLANSNVARWFVTEIFHLLGFRKEGRRGADLAFTRRRSRRENRAL